MYARQLAAQYVSVPSSTSRRRTTLLTPRAGACNGAALGAEFFDFCFGLFLSNAVSLLHDSDELVAPTIDHIEFVVSQFPPSFLDLASKLLPISFDLVPIHGSVSL